MSNGIRATRRVLAVALFTALSVITTPGAHLNPGIVNNISVGPSPRGIAVNPATNRVYVANGLAEHVGTGGSNSVSVIDGATETVLATIDVGDRPAGVAVNSITNRTYVANSGSNTVSVIDGATNLVIATIAVGSQPTDVAVNAVTNRVYVGNVSSHNVSVLDAASDTVLATVPVGLNPLGVAVNAVTNRVYVANFGSDTVSVINGADNTELTTIPTQHWPSGVGVNATTNRIYVSSWDITPPIKVIDGVTNTVMATIVGSGSCTNRARGVAVDEANNVVHVAYRCGGGSGGALVSIDGASNTQRSYLFVCCNGAPLYADLNPVTDRLYLSLPGWAYSPAEAHWVAVVADDLDTPTWPSGSTLVVSRARLTSIALSWTPAVDSSGVTRYQVYRDGQLAVTVGAQTSAFIGGLTADTSYAFKVEACDAFGHCSVDGPSVIGKTLSVVEAIDALAGTVAHVGATDGLNAGQIAGLQAKLAAAVHQYEAGRGEEAVALLDGFVQQVDAFAQAGILSPYSAQILLYEASLIRNAIG
jgi:YVTN family beta-propeller protein